MHKSSSSSRFAGTLLLAFLVMAAVAGSAHAACDPAQRLQADGAFRVALDFVKAKNWQQAIPQLESALSICDEHVPSLQTLGRAYYEVGRFADSQTVLEKLVDVRGNDAEARDYMDLGRTLTKVKEYRKARQAYIFAQRLDPENCGILINLAILHSAVKDYSHAVDTFELALAACPEYKDKILPQLAKACNAGEKKARAIGNVEEADEYAAKYTEYANSAGGSTGYQLIVSKFRDKDYAGAVTAAEEFLQQHPKHKSARLSLARAALQTKQYAKSIQAYQKYLELDPEDHHATAALIDAFTKAGRCDEALATAQAADGAFNAKGKRYLANIYYSWGKALECASRYEEAKQKFSFVTTCGDEALAGYARQEIERQDQLLARERAQAQNAGG